MSPFDSSGHAFPLAYRRFVPIAVIGAARQLLGTGGRVPSFPLRSNSTGPSSRPHQQGPRIRPLAFWRNDRFYVGPDYCLRIGEKAEPPFLLRGSIDAIGRHITF